MDCSALASIAEHTVRTAMWMTLLLGGLWFVRRGRGRRPHRRREPGGGAIARSMSVLNERYARGEIDRDEYLERRAYLE